MAYKRKNRVYTLAWEDGDYNGLEVVVSSISMGELAELLELSQKSDRGDAKAAMELIDRLAGKLKSWNIEDDDDQPVPASFDGLKSLDPGEMSEIVTKWVQTMTRVTDELGKGSTNGVAPPPPEVSLPMDALPGNLKS
jgi:hypothetical protein